MKFTYVPIQEPDGSWKMVLKLSASQRIAAEKARRRILNIQHDWDDNPFWKINPEQFGRGSSWSDKFQKEYMGEWSNTMALPTSAMEEANTGARTAAGTQHILSQAGRLRRAS